MFLNKYTDIRVLFFDIGGVLLSDGWGTQSRKAAAEQFGVDFFDMEYRHSYLFPIYEIGKITLDEYLEAIVFHQPRTFDKEAFKAFMLAQSEELPDMLSWLKEWKQHTALKVFALKNEGRELNDYRIQKFGLHAFFDGFISSGEVGLRKPDPDIYRLALRIAQVQPEMCVYFDDCEILVASAKSLRMNAVHHQGFESTKAILENLKYQ